MDIKYGYKIEMSNNPICIEFIGVWGSGKTTVINELSKKLQSEGIVVVKIIDFDSQTMLKRYFSIGLFLLRHPLYIFRSLFFLVKILYILRPNDGLQIKISKTLIKTYIKKNIILKKKPDILLCEGAYHLLPMFIHMNKLKEKDILFFANTKLPRKSDSVVYIDVGIDVAKKRVWKDKENNFARFSSGELNKLDYLYSRIINNQNKIITILKSSSISILNINGSESLSKNTDNLLNFIRGI
jgi:thymidylate kinase